MNKLLGGLFISILIVVLFQFSFRVVVGLSMEPTYKDGEYLLVFKTAYKISKPERGDVIIYKYSDIDLQGIGRVIGLPGEQIGLQSGKVLIGGKELSEKYLSPGTQTFSIIPYDPYMKDGKPVFLPTVKQNGHLTENGSITIPESSYFVMGDNRSDSMDSRAVGFIKNNQLQGKVILRIK